VWITPTWITVASFALLGLSLAVLRLDRTEWLSDALMNLGFLGIGLSAAYVIGERLIERSERRRWRSVEQAIERRILRAALTVIGGFMDAPTLRTQITLNDQAAIPSYRDMVNDPGTAFHLVQSRVLPVAKRYTELRPPPNMTLDFTGLSGDDWSRIREGIERASGYTFQALLLFGQRPGPTIQSAVLNLDEELSTSLDLYTISHLQRSGSGEMAYQVNLLVSWGKVLHSAHEVLACLVEDDAQIAR
jgi:hypothetical protein